MKNLNVFLRLYFSTAVLLFCVSVNAADESKSEYTWLDDFQDQFTQALNNSAVWMNSSFSDDQTLDESAKAWARVQVGMEPKSGDWSKYPVKFRLKVQLPSLEERVDLILSDNEIDDFERLPLESSRPHDNRSNSDDFSAAIRLIHSSDNNAYFASRLGFGRGSIYARSFYRWRKSFSNHWSLKLQPAIEYWPGEGFGLRQLTELNYLINSSNEIRMSHSIWHIESFESPLWKHGLYYLSQLDHNNALVAGVLYQGKTRDGYEKDRVTISVRWRQRAIRQWLFFEVEPFVDYDRENDFGSEIGVALRVEGFFGYHQNETN